MLRTEAMMVLKELIALNFVEYSFVHVFERTPNQYQLQIKSKYHRPEIEEYAKQFGLSVEEDEDKEYLSIYKA